MDLQKVFADLTKASEADLTAALAHIRQTAAPFRELSNKGELSDEQRTQLGELAQQSRDIRAELARRAELAADFADVDETGGSPDARDTVLPQEPAPEAPPAEEGDEGEGSRASLSQVNEAANNGNTGNRDSNNFTIITKTTVHGDVPGFAAGSVLDREGLANALSEKAHALARSSAEGNFSVARITSEFPEDRFLGAKDTWQVNTSKIEKAVDPKAIVAAGGLCGPTEMVYDIDTVGVTDRPVRDALNRFGADRGGLRYRAPFDALTMGSGLGVWDLTADAAIVSPPASPDTNVYKSCFVVACPGLLEATIYAIYLCLEFPNITARFDPEWADATLRAADVAYARKAENELLSRLFTGSKTLTGPTAAANLVSATHDILSNLDHTLAYYRSVHRLNENVPMTWIAPRWVKDEIRVDVLRSLASVNDLDAYAVADSMIEGWFARRNVTPVWHLDGRDAQTGPTVGQQYYSSAGAGTAIPPFVDQIDTLLFPTGSWLLLDGGTLDFGLVRDSTLNKANRYRVFQESFEGVAFRGIESLRLVMTANPTGAVVGTIPPSTTAQLLAD